MAHALLSPDVIRRAVSAPDVLVYVAAATIARAPEEAVPIAPILSRLLLLLGVSLPQRDEYTHRLRRMKGQTTDQLLRLLQLGADPDSYLVSRRNACGRRLRGIPAFSAIELALKSSKTSFAARLVAAGASMAVVDGNGNCPADHIIRYRWLLSRPRDARGTSGRTLADDLASVWVRLPAAHTSVMGAVAPSVLTDPPSVVTRSSRSCSAPASSQLYGTVALALLLARLDTSTMKFVAGYLEKHPKLAVAKSRSGDGAVLVDATTLVVALMEHGVVPPPQAFSVYGADPLTATRADRRTILHAAAAAPMRVAPYNLSEYVRAGAAVNATDSLGRSPLDVVLANNAFQERLTYPTTIETLSLFQLLFSGARSLHPLPPSEDADGRKRAPAIDIIILGWDPATSESTDQRAWAVRQLPKANDATVQRVVRHSLILQGLLPRDH